MSKYELKTKKNDADVTAFLESVDSELRRNDAKKIVALMKRITKKKPMMWGKSIIGFDAYTYTSKSKITGEWPMIGLSPRKQALTIYVMSGYANMTDLLKKLGPHKTGSSCLYITDLKKIDMHVLTEIISKGYAHMKKNHSS